MRADRVTAITGIKDWSPAAKKDIVRPFALDTDLPALEKAIRQAECCRLVVLDPIDAFLGQIDSHKNAEVRALLAPLCELAEKLRVAVVGIMHLNKDSQKSAVYRGSGSLAFVAAVRMVWAFAKDPENPNRRLILPVKANVAGDVGGLAYSVMVDEFDRPCIAWERGVVTMTANEVLAVGSRRQDRPERREARAWLQELLADGRVGAKDVQQLAKEAGHKWPTVRRAQNDLGIEPKKEGFGKDAVWWWQLPAKAALEDDHEGGGAF